MPRREVTSVYKNKPGTATRIILRAIKDNPGLHMQGILRLIGADKRHITHTASNPSYRLAKAGLIYVVETKGKSAPKRLYLTPKGEEFLTSLEGETKI
jgi:DNA-binding MarR family transcriptional regulator